MPFVKPVTVQLIVGAVMVQVFDGSLTAATEYVTGVGPPDGAVTVTVADASPATAVGAAVGRTR